MEEIGFVPGKADLLNREETIESLKDIAKNISESKSKQFLIVGTTARDDVRVERLKLSKERADTIKDTLVELGIPEKKLITIGIDTEDIGFDGFILDDLNDETRA